MPQSAPSQEQPFTRYNNGRELQAAELPMHAAAEGVEVLDTELDVVVQEDKPRLLGNAKTAV